MKTLSEGRSPEAFVFERVEVGFWNQTTFTSKQSQTFNQMYKTVKDKYPRAESLHVQNLCQPPYITISFCKHRQHRPLIRGRASWVQSLDSWQKIFHCLSKLVPKKGSPFISDRRNNKEDIHFWTPRADGKTRGRTRPDHLPKRP